MTGFNYQKWSADTTVTLTHVNWHNDYRDVVRFDSQAALDQWIDNDTESVDIKKLSQAKFGMQVKIDLPFNRAIQFNYLRVSNPAMPISGDLYDSDLQRNYYYFITSYTQENPKTTVITLQLDVWQSFIYDVKFGNCYIERGHIGIANVMQFDQYGRSYLDVPEGLDVGAEYRITHTESLALGPDDMNVLICSTINLTVDPGSSEDPTQDSATGSVFNNLPTGASFYIFETVQDFEHFMSVYSKFPWVTQGIISITLIPADRYFPGYNVFGNNVCPVAGVKFYYAPPMPASRKSNVMLPDWRNADFINNILGPDYAILKKFLTYPYMMIELTTWTGSPIVIRPEAWQDANASVYEYAAFMPPGQRIAMVPRRYNADDETNIPGGFPNDDHAEFLDMAAVLDNFPTLPIVNNMAVNYLAANRNGLNFEFRTADWGQQRALAGAQAGASNANAQMGNTANQANISNRATAAQQQVDSLATLQRGITGAGSNIANGLGSANPVGGVAGGVFDAAMTGLNTATSMNQIGSTAAISENARAASASSDIAAAGAIMDTNLGFAQMAANGDYANAIAGVNAKMQDARLTQPSTAGQFGGDMFNLANNQFGYSLRWKMIGVNALRTIGNYWLRYGYAVHQFGNIPEDFKCMSKFTYWKLSETYLTKAFIPEGFQQTIRGIFEKGVTVWSDPDDIGNIRLSDNQPIDGIAY